MARIGFDNNLGFLKGGVAAWKSAGHPVESIESVDVDTMLKEKTKEDGVLDVRRTSEYNSEHVVGAVNTPLDYLEENLSKVDKSKKYYVYCRSGYRSMAFASMLRAKGYDNLVDVKGGFEAIKESGKCEITDYVAPTTLL